MKVIIIPIFLLILFTSSISFAQEGVAINNANTDPDVSALLDVSSTSKGVLIPRMTEVNKNAIITPAEGLLVYQTNGTTPGFYYYDGASWVLLSSVSTGLESITEGSSTGWRFIGTDPNNYGNIGNFAQDLSYSNTASTTYGATGDYAFASGYQSIASGLASVAMGYETVANTSHATAMGIRSTSSGFYSFSAGNNNTASGTSAISMGDNNNVSSNYGVAMGRNNTVSQINATALGYNNTASGNTSTALGYNTIASGENATATGRYTTASGAYSTAMGHMTTAKSGFETVLGRWNTDYTPANLTGWASQDRLFVIGNGTGTAYTSNALTIYKDGRMNINDAYTMPTADGAANQFLMTNGAGALSWSSSSSSGLEKITEGSNSGWRFVGAIANNYGDIGANAVDLSYSSAASSTYGATGNYSFSTGRFTTASGNHSTSAGRNSIASGNYAVSLGFGPIASGTYSVATGYSSEASGASSTAMGRFTKARSYGETALGIYNTDYTPNSTTGFSPSDRVVVVGNGTSTTPSNALIIYKDGRMNINDAYTMPTTDGAANQVLTTDGTGNITWSYTGADTDDQTLSLNGTSLSIQDGNNVDLSGLLGDNDWLVSGTTVYNNTGFIGIGTSTPAEKLEVSGGDARINSLTVGHGGGNISTNTVVGSNALANNTTGASNSVLGDDAMKNATVGNTYNTAIGYLSMLGPAGGYINTSFNVAVGGYTLSYINGGDQNVAIGYASLYSNTTGSFNQSFGNFALYENINGTANIASGKDAMKNATTGNDYNIASGFNSMRGTGAYTNSDNNIALGYASLFSISGGDYNVATGYRALHENTSGSHNQATGQNALYFNTTGGYNLASGNSTLYFATTANDYNVAIGSNAMKGTAAFTDSDYNIAMGVFSLSKISGGDYNIALGRTALEENTTGNGNIALGNQTLNTNTTGSFNTAVGYNADISSAVDPLGVPITNATAIGHDAEVNASNKIQLGDTYVTSVETSGALTTGAVTYPNIDGSSGQVLSTNGAGTISWSNPVNDNDWTISGNHLYNANSGNVGIGDNAPFQKVEIKGGDANWDLGGNAIDVDNLYLEDLSAADGIDAIGGSISFSGAGNGGGGVARRHAAITGIQTSTENDHVGLAFFTHNNATSTGDMQESMRLTHDGRVQINGTTDASGTANTGVLEIANSLRLDGNEMITNTNTVLYINHDNNGDVYFDNGTLMVDASANEVGIGTTTPSEKLDVDGGGSIEVDGEYTYESAKTHSQSFSPTAFRAMTPDLYSFGTLQAASFYTYFRTGGTSFGYATVSLNLPDGAIITQLEGWLYDNLTTNPVRIEIMRQQLGSSTTTYIARVESTTANTSTAVQNLTDNSISYSTIDNSIYSYHLRFTGRQNSSNTRLYGVKVTYTVTQAD
ncbi:hypothetical protein OAK19_05100 [Aureispira]|nr:hypothetical protein [Aureispira sp.]